VWRVVDRLRGFLNLSYKKIKRIYIKKEFLKNSENPPQPSTKGGIIIKTDFKRMSQEEFARYEDMAIDGRLIYDEYRAEEYKYFSQLSRLGYKNRHEGWSKEICEDKQAEYKREYLHSKERNGRFFRQACIMQENIRRGQTTVWKINKTQDREEKLVYALQALELILCDEGLAEHNGVNIPEYAGCEYCNGVTEWSEKLGADGKEVRFEFCPVCGRMIEEG
jgi:hypothetical protein